MLTQLNVHLVITSNCEATYLLVAEQATNIQAIPQGKNVIGNAHI